MAGITKNHTIQDIPFTLGETWTVTGTLNIDNSPVTVDEGTVVHFIIANSKQIVLSMDYTSSSVITNNSTAAYRIVIPVSQQNNTPLLRAGLFRYEMSVTLSDGTVSIQAEGNVVITTSLAKSFTQ